MPGRLWQEIFSDLFNVFRVSWCFLICWLPPGRIPYPFCFTGCWWVCLSVCAWLSTALADWLSGQHTRPEMFMAGHFGPRPASGHESRIPHSQPFLFELLVPPMSLLSQVASTSKQDKIQDLSHKSPVQIKRTSNGRLVCVCRGLPLPCLFFLFHTHRPLRQRSL